MNKLQTKLKSFPPVICFGEKLMSYPGAAQKVNTVMLYDVEQRGPRVFPGFTGRDGAGSRGDWASLYCFSLT